MATSNTRDELDLAPGTVWVVLDRIVSTRKSVVGIFQFSGEFCFGGSVMQFFHRLFFAVFFFASSGTASFAELTVTISPPNVTNSSFGAIVLEASSTHVAVIAAYPNEPGAGAVRTEVSGFLIRPFAISEIPNSILLDAGVTGLVLDGVGGSASVAARIASDTFKQEQVSIAGLPNPDLRVIFETDPRSARSFAQLLETRYSERETRPEIDRTFSFEQMHKTGIELFEMAAILSGATVLSSTAPRPPDTRARQFPEAAQALDEYFEQVLAGQDPAKPAMGGLPDPKRFETALGWLYKFTLDYYTPAAVNGCTFSEGYRLGEGEVRENTPVGLYRAVMKQIVDLRSEFRQQQLGLNRATMEHDSDAIKALEVAIDIAVNAYDLYDIAERALADAPIYSEFLLLGDFDPTVLEIVRCSARLLAQGEPVSTASIRERSLVYGTIDELLSNGHAPTPRFFGAAQSVTRLIGVGSADLVEYYDGPLSPHLIRIGEILSVAPGCLDGHGGGPLLPRLAASDLLQDVNRRLLNDVNLPVVRELMENPGVLFDPYSEDFGPLQPFKVTPDSKELSEALVFDLRMVLREQSAVEALVAGRLDRALDAEMTRAQAAIHCLWFEGLFADLLGDEANHMSVIGQVGDLLQSLQDNGVIEAADARFGNYWWRVATGMSYMFVLHGVDQDQQASLQAFIRAAIAEDRRRTAGIGDLDTSTRDHLAQMVENVVLARQALKDGKLVGQSGARRFAAATFAHENLGAQPLFHCQTPSADLQTTALGDARLSPVEERLEVLAEHGLDPLARAFELSPGGALDETAILQGPDRVEICSMIAERRAAFEENVRVGGTFASVLQFDDGAPPEHILVMSRALSLRRELGEIAPYYLHLIAPPAAAVIDEASLNAALDRAVLLQRLSQAELALLDSAAELSGRELGLIDPRLDGRSLITLRNKAIPDRGLSRDYVAASDTDYGSSFGLKARADLITETLDAVSEEIEPIIAAFKNEKPKSAGTRFPGSISNDDEGQENYAASEGAETARPAENDEGNGFFGTALDFRLQRTENKFPDDSEGEGRPIYEAELSYDRPARTKAAGRVGCATDSTNCEPFSGNAHSRPTRVPLGVYLLGIDWTDDGVIRRPSSVAALDRVRIDTRRLQEGLVELGLPEFFAPSNFTVSPTFADGGWQLTDLDISFQLRIRDVDLGRVAIRAIEDGVPVPFDAALEQAVTSVVASQITSALATSEDYIALARFPSDPATFSSAPYRFSVRPPQMADGFSYSLDMRGQTLTLTSTFDFEAFANGDKPIVLSAQAVVLLDRRGFHLRQVRFDTNGLDVQLSEISARIASQLGLPAELAESLVVLPEFDGETIGLRVRAGFSVPACGDVVVNSSITLGEDAGISRDLETLVADLGAEAIRCGIEKGALGLAAAAGELTLFGVTFGIETGANDTVALVASSGDLQACLGTPEIRISGLRLLPGNGPIPELDLSSFGAEAQTAAGRVLLCKIRTTFPALDDYMLVSDLAFGPGLIAADLQLQDIPFLGNLDLGRQNFLSLDSAFETALVAAIESRASEEISKALSARLTGGGIDLAGIGQLSLREGTPPVELSLFSEQPSLSVHGNLKLFGGASALAELQITLASGGPRFNVRVDTSVLALLQQNLQTLVGGFIPILGDQGVQIQNLVFGPLDAHGTRWGLVFGVEAELPLGPNNVEVAIERVELSPSGVRLYREIRMAIDVPMYFPPAALNRIILIYHTGQGGEDEGITIGADLTFLEPELARLLKIEALLDLRQIADLRFLMSGDLIALDTVALLESDGDISLKEGRMAFSVQSTDTIRPVLNVSGTATMDLPATRIDTKSSLAILGIDLTQSDFAFCAKDCGPSGNEEGFAQMATKTGLLIGSFDLAARTDLGLRDPQVQGGVELDLFGWRPGGAGLYADLDKAKTRLSVLGFNVTVTTPSIRSTTPSLIIDILTSIFDISLEDLLAMDLTDIRISVIHGDGSSETVSDGDSDGDTQAAASSAAAAQDAREAQEQASNGASPAEEAPEEEDDEEETALGGDPWGIPAMGNFCHKVTGDAGYDFDPGNADTRFSIWINVDEAWPTEWFAERWGWRNNEAIITRLPVRPNDDRQRRWWTSRAYTGAAAERLCVLEGGPRLDRPNIGYVGSGRDGFWARWSDICQDGEIQEFNLRPYPDPKKEEGQIVNAGLPVFCLPSNRPIQADLFFDGSEQEYIATFRCPLRRYLKREDIAPGGIYERVCIEKHGFVAVPFASSQVPAGQNPQLLEVRQELDLLFRVIRPTVLDETVAEPEAGTPVAFNDGNGASITGEYTEGATPLDVPTRTYVLSVSGINEKTDGFLQLPPLSEDWPLWDAWVNRGFEEELLWQWVRTGVRPERAFQGVSTGDALVLVPERKQTAYRFLLNTGTPENPEIVRSLIEMPENLPLSNGTLAPAQVEDHERLVGAVVDVLPKIIGRNWTAFLGRSDLEGIHVLAFLEVGETEILPEEQAMIVLLDRFVGGDVSELSYPASDAFTGRLSAAEFALDSRLRCSTKQKWADALALDHDPDVDSTDLLEKEWREAIVGMDEYDRRKGLSQSPLISLFGLDGCS